jgi:SAM-dependent methyltransferase
VTRGRKALGVDADFGRTADDYARHRAGFPPSLFDRLGAYGIGAAGQTVVDLGTGTGSLARGFALRSCRVVGIDPADELLAQARRLDGVAGVTIEYRVATAEHTTLESGTADVVCAGQCWHWFDRAAAAREAARVLRDGGFIVIAHFDWIPLAGNVVDATERLIQRHNPAWKGGGGAGVHPRWLRDLGEAGYRAIESFSYDEPVAYAHADWRGRVRASAGIGASLAPEQVDAFDRELAALLAESFPAEPLDVPHRVFAAVARKPA